MKVAVFGLGYVGTVTAACLAVNGHEVWGVDVDPGKVALVASGRSPVVEPQLEELVGTARRAGSLHATTQATAAVSGASASLICVGTPSTLNGGTDLQQVRRVIGDLADALLATGGPAHGLHAVVVRSTVPPGTVDELERELATALLGAGPAFGVAMCPEFLREGTAVEDFFEPPYTVVGLSDPEVERVVRDLFAFLTSPLHVVDIRTAESLKYACNAFHATKIAFANEMGRILRPLGVDARRMMELFCEDRQLNISPRYLRPGFAFGGSCLPKDLRSILHIARRDGLDLPLLAGVLSSNRIAVADVIDRVLASDGRAAAVLGLSFKADSDDLRESPYVDLAEALLGKGFDVRIYDPIINPTALIGANRAYVAAKLPHLQRILVDTPEEAVGGADVAVVSTHAPAVTAALRSDPPGRVIDLDGRLGPEIEAFDGYEGVAW